MERRSKDKQWKITLIKSPMKKTANKKKSMYNLQYPVSETFEGEWCKITAASQTSQRGGAAVWTWPTGSQNTAGYCTKIKTQMQMLGAPHVKKEKTSLHCSVASLLINPAHRRHPGPLSREQTGLKTAAQTVTFSSNNNKKKRRHHLRNYYMLPLVLVPSRLKALISPTFSNNVLDLTRLKGKYAHGNHKIKRNHEKSSL